MQARNSSDKLGPSFCLVALKTELTPLSPPSSSCGLDMEHGNRNARKRAESSWADKRQQVSDLGTSFDISWLSEKIGGHDLGNSPWYRYMSVKSSDLLTLTT